MIRKIKNYLVPRLKNYGFWVSIFALIPISVSAFGDMSIIPDNYKEITTISLSLLVALGITSNPTTDNSGFLDDKK